MTHKIITEEFDKQGRLVKRTTVETETDEYASPYNPQVGTGVNDFARQCPCNPLNGGSGVCGCTLGGIQVWC